MRVTLCCLFFTLLMTYLSGSEPLFEAKIYRQGSNREDLLFTFSNSVSEEQGVTKLTHTYYTAEGELYAQDEVWLRGEEFIQHTTDFYLIGERSQLTRIDDEIEITFSRGKKTRSRRVPYSEDLYSGPTQQQFIDENLTLLKEGDKLFFKLPASEFTALGDFSIIRVEDTKYDKPGMIVLKMETTFVLLSLILGRNYFVIDEETGLVCETHGPSLFRVFERGKWRYVDVEVVYTYKENERN